ncbi:interferon regulatory factor 4-like isoform X2 [Argiope bruennichi]|uniref:Interferon regulatory factor 7 like protein n=2 Tax=Argiope bruennichi TaxID=94029 RepID=A0A8T0EMR1_ARGBR|nr:interferon regulatory factor 4-like isoform X2 [Argiope bruennichi]XP_055949838.1 interferon regulatory factor 4-like isoform X2 [Argiope bruennichi]KAF8773815.1 Interferon regulatory factor 7 like protein [Argiope bruennichi]
MTEPHQQRTRLLQDFLIPNLDNGTFREKLFWVNREKGIFRISWKHQSSSRFRSEDTEVYKQWAIVKRLWNPYHRKAHTMAKQRLRAALLKLKHVRCTYKDSEYREYQIDISPDEAYAANTSSNDSNAPWLHPPIRQSSSETDESDQSLDYSYEDYLESDEFIDQFLRSNLISL